MHGVTEFGALHGAAFEGDGSSCFPGRPKGKDTPDPTLASITGDKNLVITGVGMIDSRQAFTGQYQTFNFVERILMGPRPSGEQAIAFLLRQRAQDRCEFSETGEEG